jgi:hypothetical protein
MRYYRVNNKMACEGCVLQLQQQLPKDSHAAYVRGMLFGLGAAIIGLIFYAGFTIVTNFYIGYVAFAVGWLVGKAMMLGSKGLGGRRYQIAAAAYTYAAVSIAAIPIALSGQEVSASRLIAELPRLLLLGLASPFLELQDPAHGIIGLIILMVGIRIAWQITAGTSTANIHGPYNVSAASV